MNRYVVLGISLMFPLGLITCRKAEDRKCWKSIGPETTREVALPTFTKLHVNPQVEVVLVPATEHKLVLHGGKNMLKNVSYNIDEYGFLQLKNDNTCGFLKNYKKQKVTVEVHFVDLQELFFEGTYDLTTKDTLFTTNFILTMRDGAATANLTIDCDFIQVYQEHGYGDVVLNGSTRQAFLRVKSNCYSETSNLKVDSTLIVLSTSSVATIVNAHQTNDLIVEISGRGDVIYKGTPNTIFYQQYGSGNLIQQ